MSGDQFVGHAAVFDSPAFIGSRQDGRGFWETIAAGAFDRVLSERQDVRLLVNHNADRLLARTKNGTLRLSKTKRGLRVAADLADTNLGRDTRLLLTRGDLDQMSFGWMETDDEWDVAGDGWPLRTIRRVGRLLDVSVVTFPAYEETDARLVGAEERKLRLRQQMVRLRLMKAGWDIRESDRKTPEVDTAVLRRRLAVLHACHRR